MFGCIIMLMSGYILGIHLSHGYSLPLSGSAIHRVRDDRRKVSDNIVESQILTLKLELMADPRLFPYDIDCRIQDKTVELTGVVSLEEEKALAARLTQLVTQRFASSQALREANFQVVTVRGVVSISGQTRFQVIVLEAAQAAREIPGVIAVNTRNVRLEAGND